MTIFTDTPVRRSALPEYEAPRSDYLSARYGQLFEMGMVYITQAGELVKQQEGQPKGFLGIDGRYEPESSLLRPEDARQMVRDAGVDITVPEEGIRSGALKILIDTKREEKRRNDVMSRAPTDLGTRTLGLGAALFGAASDPLNIASAFIPVLGEARYAQLLGRAGSALGRAGVRAGVGLAEGAIGSAVIEPFVYHAATQLRADYDIADSLLNIGVGSVFGGGLHVGVGAISDAFTWRLAKPTEPLPQALADLDFKGREELLRQGLAQALSSQPISIDAMLSAQMRRVLAREAPAVNLARNPVNLSRFVAGLGGVSDFQGELRALDLDKTFIPGVGRLVRENGRPLDMAREAAAEAGYFDHLYGSPEVATARSTVADFLNLLEQDARGSRVYAGEDMALVDRNAELTAARDARARLRQHLDRLSDIIDAELPDEIVIDAARRMDDGMDAEDALERAIVRDYQLNSGPVRLEREDGSEIAFDYGERRLAQREAIARGDAFPQSRPASDAGPDSEASGDLGQAESRQAAEAELDEALQGAVRLADQLGVPEILDQLSPFDDMIETAAVWGRVVTAAASCQLRRGAA